MNQGTEYNTVCQRTIGWPLAPSQRRHNGRDRFSNHQPLQCLLIRLFSRRSKKTSKLRVTGLCEGNPPVTGEFPSQMASNAENVAIWRRHHHDLHSNSATHGLYYCCCAFSYNSNLMKLCTGTTHQNRARERHTHQKLIPSVSHANMMLSKMWYNSLFECSR